MTQHTSCGCVRAIWPRRRVMECSITWPGPHNHPASTQLRWFRTNWFSEWRKSSKQVLNKYIVDSSKSPSIALMTALHTLGILSTSFPRNAFPTVLKEFPHMLRTCWLLFLHSAVQLIPNHLNWDEIGWLWRPGHLMQHSITLLLGQIALTQPGGMFRVIVLLKNKWQSH